MTLGYTLFVLAVYVLAAARITKLINNDFILDPMRRRIVDREDTAREAALEAEIKQQPVIAAQYSRRADRWAKFYEFVSCPWCVGFWAALAGAVPAVWVIKYGWTLDWWAVLPIALAASHLIGVAAELTDRDEIAVVKK